MKKRKLFFTRDTLDSDKKKINRFRVKCSIIMKKLMRQISFKLAVIALIALIILGALSLSFNTESSSNNESEIQENSSEKGLIAFVTLSITTFSILMVITRDIVDSFSEFNGSFIVENGKTKKNIMEKITSTPEYKKSGYEWIDYNGENKYEISDEINKFLVSTNFTENKKKLKFVLEDKRKKFIVPNESLRALDHRIKEAFQYDQLLFNSDLIRLSTDILNSKGETLYLGKTDYFAHISTNGCIYESIRKYSNVDYQFEGYRFSVKDGNIDSNEPIELSNLKDSYCANSIGMSTLAITNDGKIVILIQGKANESSGRLVPSGSGSAEYSTLEKKKDYGEKNSFTDLITYEMCREMLEELQISKINYNKIQKSNYGDLLYVKENIKEFEKDNHKVKDIKAKIKDVYDINKYNHKTYLLGCCRFLHRSGKPDFIGITKLDVNHLVLKDYFKMYNNRIHNDGNTKNEMEEAFFIDKISVDAPYKSITDQTCNAVISLQLKYIVDELVKIKKNPKAHLNLKESEKPNSEQKEFLDLVDEFFK